MQTILRKIQLFFFGRFFKKYVGHSINDAQKEMFSLVEQGEKLPVYSRQSGVSSFIVVYAHFKQRKGIRTIVIGSHYLKALAQSILQKERKFPIFAHNSDFVSTESFDLLLIDESKEINEKFREKLRLLTKDKNVKIIELTTK